MRKFILLIPILLYGCATFDINATDKPKIDDIKGVPFYLKKGLIKQTTIYTRTWIDIGLAYSEGKKNSKPLVVHVYAKAADEERVIIEAIKAFKLTQSCLTDSSKCVPPPPTTATPPGLYVEAFKTFEATFGNAISCKSCIIKKNDLEKEANNLSKNPNHNLQQTLISNSTEVTTFVDYSTTYYFNAITPPLGTATATVKLSADGTLTEATTTLDSTKLAESIPLKDLFTDVLGLGAAEAVEAVTDGAGFIGEVPEEVFTMTITKDGYSYTLTKNHVFSLNQKIPNSEMPILKFGDTKNIKIVKISKEGLQKKPNKNAIKFGGTLEIPDHWLEGLGGGP